MQGKHKDIEYNFDELTKLKLKDQKEAGIKILIKYFDKIIKIFKDNLDFFKREINVNEETRSRR